MSPDLLNATSERDPAGAADTDQFTRHGSGTSEMRAVTGSPGGRPRDPWPERFHEFMKTGGWALIVLVGAAVFVAILIVRGYFAPAVPTLLITASPAVTPTPTLTPTPQSAPVPPPTVRVSATRPARHTPSPRPTPTPTPSDSTIPVPAPSPTGIFPTIPIPTPTPTGGA